MYRRYDSYDYNSGSTFVRSDPKVMQISLKDGDKRKEATNQAKRLRSYKRHFIFQSVWGSDLIDSDIATA